jgi:ribosomal protein L29
MKRNYREMSDIQLEKELKNLKLQLMKADGMMGMASLKNKETGESRGGTDMKKRIRKEIARVLTIKREKEIQTKNEISEFNKQNFLNIT